MTLAPENPVNLQIADGERPGDLAVFYDPLSYSRLRPSLRGIPAAA